MIWIVVIGIVGFIFIRFFSDLNKDNTDLQGQPLSKKFAVIMNTINRVAYDGMGKVTVIDKRNFKLYQDGQNQIINFQYGTGHLTITWKYKYFQKEIVHEKTYNNVRNLSLFEQQKIADNMISEMEQVVENHKNNVIGSDFSNNKMTQSKSDKNDETINYNRLYVSGTNSSYHCLKFFEDGEVIDASVNGNILDTHVKEGLDNWFKKGYHDKGHYTVNEAMISFTTKSISGEIAYSGRIEKNELILNVHSHINGNKFTERYKCL
jgi:hypothetical protein